MLFVMDFAVNQKTGGLFLYRVHDDLWLWHHDARKVVVGWQEMQRYAQLVGLNINWKKTGSATLGADSTPELPVGDVCWGFMRLDVEKSAWVIDQAIVDEHIAELRRQLSAVTSIFGIRSAFDAYIRFIHRNLGGKPANCFGRAHIDEMVTTLARVQEALFPGAGGIVGHLRTLIRERFGMDQVPLGWFFFPNSLGGLGLHSALVDPLALREAIVEDPQDNLRKRIEGDHDEYRRLRSMWETTEGRAEKGKAPKQFEIDFEEYTSGREAHLTEWCYLYRLFLSYEDPREMKSTAELTAALEVLSAWPGLSSFQDWDDMGYYTKWIVALYCSEVTETFGSLAIVDPALIPVGMLELFKSTQITWAQ